MKFKYVGDGAIHLELSARDLSNLYSLIKDEHSADMSYFQRDAMLNKLSHYSRELHRHYNVEAGALAKIFEKD